MDLSKGKMMTKTKSALSELKSERGESKPKERMLESLLCLNKHSSRYLRKSKYRNEVEPSWVSKILEYELIDPTPYIPYTGWENSQKTEQSYSKVNTNIQPLNYRKIKDKAGAKEIVNESNENKHSRTNINPLNEKSDPRYILRY